MVVYGGWGPKVLLDPVPKGSAWFLYVLLGAVDMWAAKPVYHPTCLELVAFVLRGHEKGYNGTIAFKVHLDPQAVAGPFELLSKSFYIGYHYGNSFAVGSVIGVLLCWLLVVVCPLWMLFLQLNLNLFCRLLSAYGGKLQASRAFLMCFISCCRVCWLVQTTLVLNAKVLKTLFSAVMKWLLSQCRYWSLCVGFL